MNPRPIDWWNGDCYTSTMRDEFDGTVVRSVKEVILDRSRWDYVEIEAPTHEHFKQAMVWAAREVATNTGYSRADLAVVIPIARHFIKKNKRNICSEFVDIFMVRCGSLIEHRLMSPRRQAYIIFKELGKEFKPVEWSYNAGK
jgi:hypothetical protein